MPAVSWTSKPPLGAQIGQSLASAHAFFHALDLRRSLKIASAVNVVERDGYGATGVNGYFYVPKSQWINANSGVVTTTFYYPAGKSGYLWSVWQDWSGTRYYRCYVSAAGIVSYQWNNPNYAPNSGSLSATVPLIPNAVNTVQIASNGAGKQIYLNGLLVLDTTTGGASCWLNEASATFGAQYYGVRFGGDFRFGIATYSNFWFESFGVAPLSALSELVNYGANPWQVYQPPRRVGPAAGGGATTYTEPLTALAESYASVTSIATMIDAGEAIIEAGVSATATIQMLEGLLTTAESASVAAAIVQRVETLLATIQAVDSVQTAAALVEALIATASSDAAVADSLTTAGVEAVTTAVEAVVTVADVAQYQAQLLAAAGVTTAVADTVGAAEAPQASATAAASVQDIVQMLEQVYTAATAQAAVTDSVVTGIAESLITSATAITSATDVQLMVDNITIMVASHASIGEIHSYLEQLATAATSGASVTDVLVTAFVGTYIFRDFCTPRRFHDLCTPRSFHDLCTPRGAA